MNMIREDRVQDREEQTTIRWIIKESYMMCLDKGQLTRIQIHLREGKPADTQSRNRMDILKMKREEHLCSHISYHVCTSIAQTNYLTDRWNSSAMRRWLKENNLSPGSGAPLHDIAAIEDLQRALTSFSGTIPYHTIHPVQFNPGHRSYQNRAEKYTTLTLEIIK